MIISVLELTDSDPSQVFFVDTDKINLEDPQQKEYKKSIDEALADEDLVANTDSDNSCSYGDMESEHFTITKFPITIEKHITLYVD